MGTKKLVEGASTSLFLWQGATKSDLDQTLSPPS